MANREELEQKNVDELRELAREQEVEGRSSMNKEDLVNALADDGSSNEGDGSVSEGGDEVRDAQDLLTPTGESEDGGSQGADERKAELEELTPEASELAADEMDFSGPLHLQSPEERIMTGAVSEAHAEEQKKLLANKPDDYVGEVTEAGFDEDGNVKTAGRRVTAPAVEVIDEDVADAVGKESRGERRERQGVDPNAGESLRELSDNAEAVRSGDRDRDESTPEGESSSDGDEVSDTGGEDERNQPRSEPGKDQSQD